MREDQLRAVLSVILLELQEILNRRPFLEDKGPPSELWPPYPNTGFLSLREVGLLGSLRPELLGPVLSASEWIHEFNFLIDCQVHNTAHSSPVPEAKGFLKKKRDECEKAIVECIASIDRFLKRIHESRRKRTTGVSDGAKPRSEHGRGR